MLKPVPINIYIYQQYQWISHLSFVPISTIDIAFWSEVRGPPTCRGGRGKPFRWGPQPTSTSQKHQYIFLKQNLSIIGYHSTVLYVILCFIILYYIVLYCIILYEYYIILYYYFVLCYIILYYIIVYYIIFFNILLYIILFYFILHYIILYYIISYYIILHYIY